MKLKSILFGGVCGLAAAESFAGKPTFLRFDMNLYGEKDWRNVYNKGKPIGKQIMPVPLWAYEKDGKTHFAEFRIVKKWEENGEDCYRMYVYCGASIEREGGVVGFRAKKTDDGILNVEGVFTMKYSELYRQNAGKCETLSREEGEWALKVEMQRHCSTKDAKKVMGSVFIDGKPMAENNDRLPVDCRCWYSFIRGTGEREFETDGYCAVFYSQRVFFAAMGAFSAPSSSCPSFLPSAGHLADTSPLKWKRLNALQEYDSVFGDCEEALDLSCGYGFRCFRAYSEAAKKTVRFEVIFFQYNNDFSDCPLKDVELCSFCKEFREVLNHWYDPSCFEKEPSCSLFETNKIIQKESDGDTIETASDPFEEDGGHPVFLRDCDLSVLPPDDVRRKHNIQPFPTLGYVSLDKDTWEYYDFVPFKEKRIFRSRQKIKDGVRNRFIVFVRIPDDVSSDENKKFAVDVPYWSIQAMTSLSDVCVSSYVEFLSDLMNAGRCSGYKSSRYIVPIDFRLSEKKRFRVYRFEEDGKIAERNSVLCDMRLFYGTKYVQLLSNDDYCYLSLRRPWVPAGTAYSFDDYELSHRQNLRYQEGQWLCNFDEKKNGLEPKYFLTKKAGAEYGPLRYIEMIVVCLPENIKDFQSKLVKKDAPHAYDIKKLEAVYKHWDDESWFEPKPKAGEARVFPSLTVEELLGVIGKEEAEKRGYKFEDEEPKAEDQKEDPKVKSKVVYTKDTSDKK